MGRARRREAAALGVLLGLPVHAHAQEVGRFRLAWARDEGADRCPDGPTLALAVARHLGANPFVHGDAPSIEGSVRRDGARWIARLVVRDAAGAPLGARDFTSEAPGCDAIASAVTLGVALAIDPEAALRPPPTAPPPVPAAPSPPAARRAPGVVPWSRGAGVTVRALGGVGLLPGVAPGVALAVEGPIRGRFRWSVGLAWYPESTLSTGAGSFAFGLVAAWAAPCVEAWRAPAASLSACVGLDVGALSAVVLQGEPSAPGERPWAAAFASLRLRGRIWRGLAAEAGVEVLAPLVRDRFHQGGAERATAFQQAPVAGVAFAGLGAQFP